MLVVFHWKALINAGTIVLQTVSHKIRSFLWDNYTIEDLEYIFGQSSHD
jgi:hypothetical protein